MKKLEQERSEMQKRQKRESQLKRHLSVQLKNQQPMSAVDDVKERVQRNTHRRYHSRSPQSEVVTKKLKSGEYRVYLRR